MAREICLLRSNTFNLTFETMNSTAMYRDQEKIFLVKIFSMTLNHDHKVRSNFDEIARA